MRRMYRLRLTGGFVEILESRTLLNATVTGAIPTVSAAQNSSASTVDLSSYFNDPTVTGTAVILHTTQGDIPLTLFDSQTPQTVANFLSYINNGEYNGTVIQRLVQGFIMQGGQFLPDGSSITAGNSIPSEAGIPNTTGTIAMALNSSGANSATDAWFINLANNSPLDGTQDGGPFTVFGKVIYNGMNIVNQISALPEGLGPFPVIPGDPAGGTVPLQNYTSGTPTAANFVTIPSFQIVPALSYSVTSSNTTLVTPSISNSTLTLTYGAGQTGVANITVMATDLGGNTVQSVFEVAVGSILGKGGAKSVRYQDADGTNVTLGLTGPGSATLEFSGTGVTQTLSKQGVLSVTGSDVSLSSISLAGANSTTTLNITGTGGDGVVPVGTITSDGGLRTINGTKVSLTGSLSAAGSVGKIAIGSASGGTMTLSGTSGTLTFAVPTLSGETINFSQPVIVQSTTVSGSTITAASISRITVSKSLSADITATSVGTTTAGTISSSAWNVSGAVGNITAASINGLSLSAGSLGRVTSRADITNSQLMSAANIAAVAAATFSGSRVYAGNPTVAPNGIPTAFPTSASIASVTIGRGGFSNSIIGASVIGHAALSGVTTQAGGAAFGVAATQFSSLTATVDGKRLSLGKTSTQGAVTAALTKAGITPNNFEIEIV